MNRSGQDDESENINGSNEAIKPEDVTIESAVEGERGASIANSARSMQSRVSSVLAAGLMIILGVGALTWYYASALKQQAHARQVAQAASASHAQGEMSLPSLGRIELPRITTTTAPKIEPGENGQQKERSADMTPADAGSLAAPTPELPLERTGKSWNSPVGASPPWTPVPQEYGSPQVKTRAQRNFERRLAGTVFARQSEAGATPQAQAGEASSYNPGSVTTGFDNQDRSDPGFVDSGLKIMPEGNDAAELTPAVRDGRIGSQQPSAQDHGGLTEMLRPSVTPAARATVLPTQRFLLPKGAFIDCTLETAIDSTLPGMTTCVTATDTFGVDGRVVLLERGTKLVGETRGQVQQGAARVFVLWTEARTPSGVVVALDSPGTDELGRSGLAGEVNRHFWDRFGAAMLISLLDGTVQSAIQASNRGGGTVIYNPSASQEIVTEVLKSTIDIPPAITKNHGDRIQVLVARDLDFRSVYELRTATTGR